ncbi:MAG: hypothetical protein LBJ84_05000 [Oscillospiraceae bacterium]|jgi:hypothetical protein|nr:hypothetical protein [Oscillospiraceae bacterium]
MSVKQALRDYNLLKVEDDISREIYYGCRQQWYATGWKRVSGCGPSVVSTIMNYMERSQALAGALCETSAQVTKERMVCLMDDVWISVTPTLRGIPNTRILREGIERYASRRSLELETGELSIPGRREARPPLSEVISFLKDALAQDVPVAFLSLDNGDEKALDTWHWVVLVSVEHDPGAEYARIEVIDECRLFGADLRKWYETTSAGGGFVSLRRACAPK